MKCFACKLHHVRCPLFDSVRRFLLSIFRNERSHFFFRRIARVVQKGAGFMYAVLRDQRPSVPYENVENRVLVRGILRAHWRIIVNVITNSRLAIMRTSTVVGRRLSIVRSRQATILISEVLRLGTGFFRAFCGHPSFLFKGIRNFINVMEGV